MQNFVQEIKACRASNVEQYIKDARGPLVLRGLVSDWPIVSEGNKSNLHAVDYLKKFYKETPVTAAIGSPNINGRIFYNDDMTAFNYHSQKVSLRQVLDKILLHQHDAMPPTIYVASTMIDHYLPDFRTENDFEFPNVEPLVSIWLGNKSRIAAHFDVPDNIACSVVGRRRFTLFPPDQLANLYPGPLEWAPGGQAISLIDFHKPDYNKYPRFKNALKTSQVTELNPGDALFIPSMWWHHVEALDSFNVLVNYWWRQSPAYMSSPAHTLTHALLTMRELPKEQKKAWQNMFEHYIFNAEDEGQKHIPNHAQGFLAKLDDALARKIRAFLLNKLNR